MRRGWEEEDDRRAHGRAAGGPQSPPGRTVGTFARGKGASSRPLFRSRKKEKPLAGGLYR